MRGSSYSHDETVNIIRLVAKHLPQCFSEWENILTEHNKHYPHTNHDVLSIRQKFHHVRQLKPATGDPNMPQHVRDAKTAFYNMRLKADCCTGLSSDEEAREYFLKNGFASVPEEVQSASTARNIRNIINLDSSDSDDSSVFMPRGEGEKKETKKDNKGKGKRKYFYESDSSSSIEGKKKQTKKSNIQIKTKEEIKMSEKTKKDVEGILMYKKKQPVKKEGKMQDPGVVMVQGLLQSREEDRRMREHLMEIYRLEMERMEKQCEQREDKRDRRHHELMMMLMMTVSGKDTSKSMNCTTNNPIVSPFAGGKKQSKNP